MFKKARQVLETLYFNYLQLIWKHEGDIFSNIVVSKVRSEAFHNDLRKEQKWQHLHFYSPQRV